MNQLKLFVAFFFVLINCLGCVATNPYNPTTDKVKIAKDLNISENSIQLHSRCLYAKLYSWQSSVANENVFSCVALLTNDRLIVSTYDTTSGLYSIAMNIRFD